MFPAAIESQRSGEISAFAVMEDFERVNDFPPLHGKAMAGAVELRDQNPQVKPLQVETAEVTSFQKLREPGGEYAEFGLIFDISVGDSMNRRGGFRNRNSRIDSPAAVVPASIREDPHDRDLDDTIIFRVRARCLEIDHGQWSVQKKVFKHVRVAPLSTFRRPIGGTLFLDELGEYDSPLRIKLLGALQPPPDKGPCLRELYPMGADERATSDVVRVVAATNADLLVAIAQGKYQEKLY